MKHRRLLFRIIFVAVLILIIIYTFRDSAYDIVHELANTSLTILTAIFASSVIYHLFEAWVTYSLARKYNPEFRYRNALYCAFNCSFFRLSTLGSGAGIAAVVYLGKKGVGYSEALGLYLIQYMLHKVSIAIFSGVLFLINLSFMRENYSAYRVYLGLAYLLTAAISLGLILLAASPKSHALIIRLLRRINIKGWLSSPIERLENTGKVMEESSVVLLKDPKTIVVTIIKNLVKLFFWYNIPFLILFGSGSMSLLNSLSVTSLGVMTAAVIPTPAGIGALELIMTGLFSIMIGKEHAAVITLLYRIATFIFPFAVGAVLIIVARIVTRIGLYKPK